MSGKSAVSFIRQQLKVKGASEHSGRGFYILGSNEAVSFADIKAKVENLLPRWQERGLVESAEVGAEIKVVFVKDKFDEYYRTFFATERLVNGNGYLGLIQMTWPNSLVDPA